MNEVDISYISKVNTVIFRRAWGTLFDIVSDKDAGRLIKAIFATMNGEEVDLSDNKTLFNLYLTIILQLEDSAEKFYKASISSK